VDGGGGLGEKPVVNSGHYGVSLRAREKVMTTCPKCGKELKKSMAKLYHFLESGLPNVFLQNIALYQCACGEKLVQIPAMDRLLDAIAFNLLKKRTLLTGLKWIGLTANGLAALLGVKSRISISRWENGRAPLTAATDHAMRLLVMRVKEEAVKQRMFMEIEIQEQFERISAKPGKSERMVITQKTLDDLPFPPQRHPASYARPSA
jgi:transcriptional regulator with XRE-family HTH domain